MSINKDDINNYVGCWLVCITPVFFNDGYCHVEGEKIQVTEINKYYFMQGDNAKNYMRLSDYILWKGK